MAMDSFFLTGARPLVEGSPSMRLHELLDWHAIAAQLTGLYLRELSGADGPEPYSPLGMFKLMLLGILFFLTFFNFSLAIRYYNHASFMINTNAQDDPAVSAPAVTHVLNQGALHYTFGMRGFYLSVPLALWPSGSLARSGCSRVVWPL